MAERRANRILAIANLKAAIEFNDSNELAGGLIALRAVAEAAGGLAAIAEDSGLAREALYRALSSKGNPTLKTMLAVLTTLGLRLSIECRKPAGVAHSDSSPLDMRLRLNPAKMMAANDSN